MPVIIVSRYTREDLKDNPDALFMFGDNMTREGYGGQAAAARDEPNAVGIPTLWAPGQPFSPGEWETDEFDAVMDRITKAMLRLYDYAEAGKVVILPRDGVGTGIANLQENCPELLKFIQACTNDIKRVGSRHDA